MAVKLHQHAVEYAKKMIRDGKIDYNTPWHTAEPTPESEDAYLNSHSFDQYGNWFLGIDGNTNPQTKEHYSFPIGNFNKIYRSALIAAEQRAAQYHHEDIKTAAKELLDMVD